MLIKNCPFCGSEAKLFHGNQRGGGHSESEDDVGVKCTGCGVSILINDYAGNDVDIRVLKSMELWNNRV